MKEFVYILLDNLDSLAGQQVFLKTVNEHQLFGSIFYATSGRHKGPTSYHLARLVYSLENPSLHRPVTISLAYHDEVRAYLDAHLSYEHRRLMIPGLGRTSVSVYLLPYFHETRYSVFHLLEKAA